MVEQSEEQVHGGEQRLIASGGCLTAVAGSETPWARAEVPAARNVRRWWKRLARLRRLHRPNRGRAASQRRLKCRK
jgi:hypothetical protein